MMHGLTSVVVFLALIGSTLGKKACPCEIKWTPVNTVMIHCQGPCTPHVREVPAWPIGKIEGSCACPPTPAPVPGGGTDPRFGGFRGQFLTFQGEDDRWYSILEEDRFALRMRTVPLSCVSSGGSYISSLGITVPNTKESSSATTIGIFNNLDENCQCKSLLDSEIQVELNGEALSPGVHFDPATELKLVFEHTVAACQYQYRPKVQLQHATELTELAHGARRLGSGFGSSDPETFAAASPIMEGSIANSEACKRWNANVSGIADSTSLYTAGGTEASTIIVSLPDIELRIEHKTTICGSVRLDFHLLKYDAPADASGILGQTVNLQYDASGTPIYKGDGVLPGREEDYEVSGPFSEYL